MCDGVSSDTWAQIAGMTVSAIVAAGVGVIGALIGAREGAKATREATREAIGAERTAEQERREEATRAAFLALAVECQVNAQLLQRQNIWLEHAPGYVALERVAADAAVPEFRFLPPALRHDAESIRTDVVRFNGLATFRRELVTRGGRNVGIEEELGDLIRVLPRALNALARDLGAFVEGDRPGDQPATE